jgi:TRAP-type C4-dicarboxylate transport system substrate-binding protein
MNMKKWNSLPDDIKKIIDSYVTPEAQKWTNKEVLAEESLAVTELKKRGMQFVDPDPGTIAECKQRIGPVYDMYEKKYGKEGQELLAAAKAGLK